MKVQRPWKDGQIPKAIQSKNGFDPRAIRIVGWVDLRVRRATLIYSSRRPRDYHTSRESCFENEKGASGPGGSGPFAPKSD
jgi:hypothetical protein